MKGLVVYCLISSLAEEITVSYFGYDWITVSFFGNELITVSSYFLVDWITVSCALLLIIVSFFANGKVEDLIALSVAGIMSFWLVISTLFLFYCWLEKILLDGYVFGVVYCYNNLCAFSCSNLAFSGLSFKLLLPPFGVEENGLFSFGYSTGFD